jgi:hypothetical protein
MQAYCRAIIIKRSMFQGFTNTVTPKCVVPHPTSAHKITAAKERMPGKLSNYSSEMMIIIIMTFRHFTTREYQGSQCS